MTKTLALLASGALALSGGVLAGASPAAATGGRPFTTTLLGAAERPVLGDPDGSGTATLRVNPGQRELCYTLTVSGIASARAAHVHEAPAGAAGPIVVGLAAPTNGASSGCVSITRKLAREIIQSPEDYYVNVHNVEFPGGALRGQLSR